MRWDSKTAFSLIGFLVALITFASIVVADPLTVEREAVLKDNAEVWSQTVCLGDLTSDTWLQGRCAVDKKICCRWSLGEERTRFLKLSDLRREISHVKFGALSVELKGPEVIAVTQIGRELSAAEIQGKVRAAVASRLGEDEKNVLVTSLKLQTPIRIAFTEESDWDVLLPEVAAEYGSVKVVSTKDAARVLGWAQVSLRVDGEVFVAKRTIRPSEVIRVEDFELRRTNVLGTQSAGIVYFRKQQFPEGVRARISVLAGAALTSSAIERVPMVRLGDTVTLILRGDNLRISTKGVVQGSAAIGDMVTVQLSRYNRTFRGRLIDGRLVEVWL